MYANFTLLLKLYNKFYKFIFVYSYFNGKEKSRLLLSV